MNTIKDLEAYNKKDKISDPYRNKEGLLIRKVDGIEIVQIEEKTEYDRRFNSYVNLWRMRSDKTKL